ncbi:acetolactate synthase small subunit [Buchnera aphidicola str. Bp (Baizongia pistaciae)]|uniref:Acetolactate synthase small subunit n=1 Tax=Buchnera aphidicola subsp. Baizongia pistaciae (strain Bp) TaxID=224915 RepID=ILVH_BUCBP|nr:acetolactate synthase small subunit [Buchnera aphidicola]Q89AP8.1 RecName: Full=Acetolactate synthase small subunit; AltName: Full=Acetohydroxy-acid synthase small subunit; Short=AHAS; Short=ALS [Buchnera aphidicola str. Bp (Baizongia pistaciae)]AAO26939.1 acetolactate synthase small subunit [Buchnera aphidicola str. Bp (Baizongia pistaciae)]
MKHRILSILLENESGALSRVVGLFSQRGYNIESITVAPTEDLSISKITIQTFGDKKVIEQIGKQLHKLIDVLKVTEIEDEEHFKREIMLIKINNTYDQYRKVQDITNAFRGYIISATSNISIIQLSGTNKNLDTYIEIMKKLTNIIEISRSGIISIYKN